MLTHTCESCGKQFTKRKNPNRPYRFCSKPCAGRAFASNCKVSSSCAQCGGAFEMWPSEAAKGRQVCSTGCATARRDKGLTSAAFRLRTSPRYADWRQAVFARDDFTCQICGQRGGKLNADHIKRFSDFPELRLSIDNGRTLCVPCHLSTDTFGNRKRAVVVGEEA